MKPIILSLFMLLLLLSTATYDSLAQSKAVPADVKRLARDSLSCHDPDVSSARIGPAKRGYVATCGGTEIAIFEIAGTHFNKVFQVGMPMRAEWSFDRRSNKGYYNFGWVVLGNSGGACVETYRWNGNTYVKILDRCE